MWNRQPYVRASHDLLRARILYCEDSAQSAP
jgi:hypothetical protein